MFACKIQSISTHCYIIKHEFLRSCLCLSTGRRLGCGGLKPTLNGKMRGSFPMSKFRLYLLAHTTPPPTHTHATSLAESRALFGRRCLPLASFLAVLNTRPRSTMVSRRALRFSALFRTAFISVDSQPPMTQRGLGGNRDALISVISLGGEGDGAVGVSLTRKPCSYEALSAPTCTQEQCAHSTTRPDSVAHSG